MIQFLCVGCGKVMAIKITMRNRANDIKILLRGTRIILGCQHSAEPDLLWYQYQCCVHIALLKNIPRTVLFGGVCATLNCYSFGHRVEPLSGNRVRLPLPRRRFAQREGTLKVAGPLLSAALTWSHTVPSARHGIVVADCGWLNIRCYGYTG